MGREVILCCCLMFVVIPLLIWASVMIPVAIKSYTPDCYLHDLYIPALNTKLLTTYNSSIAATFIFFDVELQNVIERQGVRFSYYNSTLAIYYAKKAIANYTVPTFSQGGDEATHLHDVVETLGMPWPDAFATVSGGSAAVFTVELATTVKVRKEVARDKKLVLLLRADVEVNDSGEKAKKKNIKLVPFVKSISTNFPTSLQSDDGVYSA